MKEETIKKILKFRDDRDWKQFHNPKDLASISLEAAELLEVFQWSAGDVSADNKIIKIREELADVINYCVLMADACNLDIDEIVQENVLIILAKMKKGQNISQETKTMLEDAENKILTYYTHCSEEEKNNEEVSRKKYHI